MGDGIEFWGKKFRVQPMAKPELRKDPLVSRWVLVSTDRLGRPQDLSESAALMESSEPCPFCKGNEDRTRDAILTIPDATGNWRIRIVPNLFPAVRDVGAFVVDGDGPCIGGAGAGIHEVIIESPHHETEFANLPPEHIAEIFRAYAERISAARSDSRWHFPVVFKNCGAAAGASLEHVHSQLVLMPLTPPEIAAELWACETYWNETDRCFFCDAIASERDGPRFVLETDEFFVYMPYAGRFPFEMCLLPKQHHSHFDRQPADTWGDLGEAVADTLRRLTSGLDKPPYNYVIHTMPLQEDDAPHYHWHLEIIPRLNNIGGFEWGTGCNINTVPPEQAAAFLRNIVSS
jgi:UDPglucose--hexose-1-phosphate uridylyltransferase